MCPCCGSKDVKLVAGVSHEFARCNVCNFTWTTPIALQEPAKHEATATTEERPSD